MRKYARKFLAFFVSFVMAVVMVPMNGFNSYAADTTVTVITYQKVTSTNNWDSDGEYVIYSNGYALVNDNGSISAQQVTLTGENPTVPDAAIWKIFKSGSNYNISNKLDNNKYLNISEDKLSLGSIQGLNIKKDGANKISYGENYLRFENNYWTATSSKKSKVEIYKKVTETKTIKDLTPDEKLYNDDTTTGAEKPDYPNQGSVRINKQATSADFNGTGVAEVELGVTGVPMKKGADIVLVFDVSSSMNADGSTDKGKSVRTDAINAANQFVDKVLGDNADKTKSNNRLALVTFAGWRSNYNSNNYTEGYGNEIKYPLKNANSKDDIKKTITNLKTNNGTDYDYAFKAANEILKEADPNREKYIVFMTDGGPTHYNGSEKKSSAYNNGAAIPLNKAESIKDTYGDKVKIYSIGFGFGINNDNIGNNITSSEGKAILQGISSGEGYFVEAQESTDLENAFDKIATSIKKAGEDAVVTDIIGDSFQLQMTKKLPNSKPDLSYDPTIKVTLHDVYTKADVGNKDSDGNTITSEYIGKRKGSSEIIEIVSFSPDGKEAYSDKIGNGTNILQDGVINAKTFTYTVNTKTFEWHLGTITDNGTTEDITEKEITLNYFVYLKGSMEGTCSDGLYSTNESAKLNYTNYLGHSTEQVFDKPNMPWGAAVVNYEFYLVNEDGDPVNTKGEVIPFEKRVKISATKSQKFNWNSGTEVTAETELKAQDLVPKGYTLHIKDAVYKVSAVSSGNGSYEILGTVDSGDKQSTVLYSHNDQFSNSSVAFGVINELTLIPDTVVLDYGKPIDIDVMENDNVLDAELYAIAANDTNLNGTKLGSGNTPEPISEFIQSGDLTLNNGKAKIENGKVVYTPTKYMDSIDKFLYCSKETTDNTTQEVQTEQGTTTESKTEYAYRYQTVSVIPATTVYYEDNFGNKGDKDTTTGIYYSGTWSEEGTSSSSKQDSYVEGKGVYGSDSHYDSDATFSGGSSHVVIGTANADTTASFKFKGTGFDLISRTDTNSTRIAIKVTDKDGKVVKTKAVDNLYQSGALYQIPVYELHNLPYGEYTVTIIVGSSKEGATFYLDAIRIYDPLGESSTDNTDFEEGKTQYDIDKESNASITELRDLLISAESFKANQEGTAVNGAVFIDNNDNVTDIATYKNQGPNNEVYLAKGQSIAFNLNTTGEPESIQIGAKAPNGNAKFKFGSNTNIEKEIPLNTATDMNYEVKNTVQFINNSDGSKQGIVVITNTGDNIVSLTNIKITYKDSAKTTSFNIDNNTVEQSLKVAKLRMTQPEDNSSEDTSTDDNQNDDNQSSSDNTESNILNNIANSIRNWLSKWF